MKSYVLCGLGLSLFCAAAVPAVAQPSASDAYNGPGAMRAAWWEQGESNRYAYRTDKPADEVQPEEVLPSPSDIGEGLSQPAQPPREPGYPQLDTPGSRESIAPYPLPRHGGKPLSGGDCHRGDCQGGSAMGGESVIVDTATPESLIYDGVWSDCGAVAAPRRRSSFYVGASGLVMNRDRGDRIWLSYDDDYPAAHVMDTYSPSDEWAGGFEIWAGWCFSPCLRAEVVYWGLFPGTEESNIWDSDLSSPAANLNTSFDFGPLVFDDGANEYAVNDYFDAAQNHRFRRGYEVHNVEVNLIGGTLPCFGCSSASCGCGIDSCGAGGCGAGHCNAFGGAPQTGRLQIDWLLGFRYFKYDDWFLFSTTDTSPYYGVSPDGEAHYGIDLSNELIGLQLGGQANWCVWEGLSLFAAPRFGVYGNHMKHHSYVYSDGPSYYGANHGFADVGSANPINPGDVFNVRSEKDDVAFIGQLDAGIAWQLGRHINLFGGYRVVTLQGVAITTDQIPASFGDIYGVADINNDGCEVLHGAFFGAEFCW